MTSEGWKCCKIGSVCGYSLARSIIYVGIATMIISIVSLASAVASIKSLDNEGDYNNNPLNAVDLLCSLSCCSLSVYQFIISLILVSRKTPYACSLWFVSHLSILPLYGLMFTARAYVACKLGQYHLAMYATLAIAVYEGVFIFFLVIIYSYMHQPVEDSNVNWYY